MCAADRRGREQSERVEVERLRGENERLMLARLQQEQERRQRLREAAQRKAEAERLALLERAHSVGLFLRPIWSPLHQLPMYEACPAGSLDVAENQAPRLLNLPSSPQLLPLPPATQPSTGGAPSLDESSLDEPSSMLLLLRLWSASTSKTISECASVC